MLATITFGRLGDAATGNEMGWSGGEDGYTWAIGPESTIRLPEGDYSAPCVLEAGCAPHLRQGLTAQRIAFDIGGCRFGEIALRASGTIAVPMPRTTDRTPVLTIHHPDASVPFPSNDSRELAIAFRHIRVLSLRRYPRRVNDIRDAERITGRSAHEIATSFESIGDDCELGFVQRALGAEPLGLLRFSSSRLPDIIRGLDVNFEDILDDLTVDADEGCSWEWITHIRRYGMNAHTFLREHQISFEEVVARERKRVGFLRRKFLDDLAEGRKIFVIKNYGRELLEPEVFTLFLAMRRHGHARLLWVSVARDGMPVGTVDEILPGLWHGYVDHFATNHMMINISVPGWLTLMTNVLLAAGHGAGNSDTSPQTAERHWLEP